MKKIIIAVSVLLSLGTVPVMADKAKNASATASVAESQTGLTAEDAYAHISSAGHADFKKCEGYEDGRDGVYPYECVVGSRSNGSDGGTNGGSDN
jgi:hypothetical protein